jgi:hypothetical protein
MELADGSLFDLMELYRTEYRTTLSPTLAVLFAASGDGLGLSQCDGTFEASRWGFNTVT